jgi:hypothetical protein
MTLVPKLMLPRILAASDGRAPPETRHRSEIRGGLGRVVISRRHAPGQPDRGVGFHPRREEITTSADVCGGIANHGWRPYLGRTHTARRHASRHLSQLVSALQRVHTVRPSGGGYAKIASRVYLPARVSDSAKRRVVAGTVYAAQRRCQLHPAPSRGMLSESLVRRLAVARSVARTNRDA